MTEEINHDDTSTREEDIPTGDHLVQLDDLMAAIDGELAHLPREGADSGADADAVRNIDISKQWTNQFIRFELNQLTFGLPLSNATEIREVHKIAPLPNVPPWILGITNVRGEIMSVVDLKRFFEFESHTPYSGDTAIIARARDIRVCLAVDRVRGMVSLDREKQAVQDSLYGHSKLSGFVNGVFSREDETVYLLDTEKLLASV